MPYKELMKNILITGGAGYIGSHIAEILVKKQFNVFILDNLSNGHKKLINKKASFFKGDIKNQKLLNNLILPFLLLMFMKKVMLNVLQQKNSIITTTLAIIPRMNKLYLEIM